MRGAAPLAVSMGDPAGIGLEIAGAAWRARAPVFCLIADVDTARSATSAPIQVVESFAAAAEAYAAALPVMPLAIEGPVRPGAPDPRHAPAILDAIARGAAACRTGEASGLVTLPVAKAPLYEAGFRFPGQTEFVASLVEDMAYEGPRGPVMMLAGAALRVALVSIHAPLAAAPALITTERVVHVGRVTAAALRRDFGLARPRLALLGLNPHAGEGGALGREEIDAINPAAALLRAEGVDITDARPSDSMFHPEARAKYDAVIAMHHDQGLIPLKMLHFWDAVNVTLGLPIVRTSPDHGVAYDIAGQGLARPDSLIAALTLAAEIAARRASRS